jgi:UDP-sugar transporter A1/2/3
MRDFDNTIRDTLKWILHDFLIVFLLQLLWSSQFIIGKDEVSTALQGWTLSSSLLLAGFPALLYAIQGVLTYIGYQNTDSVSENWPGTKSRFSCQSMLIPRRRPVQVTFNGLNQTKTLSAALWCFLLMGKRQSVVQMVALAILLFSAMLFQGSISFSGLFSKRSNDIDSDVSGTTKVDESRAKTSISKGILPCLAAAFISGLAGALSQKGVQMAGGKGRNPYLYTMELGLYSSISLLISLVTTKDGRESLRGENGIFKHWTGLSIVPVAVRSFGGILTALVHKHAGATRKGFALILGLILTGVTQSWLEGEKLSGDELTAMVLVILSSYLHLMYPPIAM